jgi:ribosomal protein S18 acetylase RimI-like enzyme
MLAAMTAVVPPQVIRRAPIEAASDALALAAQAWPPTERAGQLAALAQLVAEGKANDLVLVAARCDSHLCGAVLGQILAGRAAVVWPPQLAGNQHAEIATELLHELHHQLRNAGTCLTQALLEDPVGNAAQTLRSAGYEHAGDLLYMSAEAESFPNEPPPLGFDLEPSSPANHARLIRLLDATYRGSLDCPLVDGLRETADVLAGYRAVGQFRPELWLLAHADGRDVACLLLADHPTQDQFEIVYVGVVPQFRGRGWGLALTRLAQWLAYKSGRSRVVLAVDAANAPAIAAYASAGFVAWDRRSILVRSFGLAAKRAGART